MLCKLTLLKRICRRRERPSTGRGVIGTAGKERSCAAFTIESDEVTPDRRFRARVDDAIREGLKALGYYQPTIEFDLRPPPKKGRQVLIAKVTPRAGVNWRHRCGIARRRADR